MNDSQVKPDEVQFVVGEDWSFGPSRRLVAIPVINGDISRQIIEADTVTGLASKCAGELHSCLIMCDETPFLKPDYLLDAGDRRARFIMTPRNKELYDLMSTQLSEKVGH
jgi:hypothetical protein